MRTPPTNSDSVASAGMLSSQKTLEPLAFPSPDPELELIYKLISEDPLNTQSIQGIPQNPPLFRGPNSSNLPPQTPVPAHNTPSLCVVCSASTSLPSSLPPPNWHRIPQKTYDYGRKQWNFIPLEDISFRVNGRPGVNMGDALRKRVAGLDGQDELVLQGASSVVSCRLSVCLS